MASQPAHSSQSTASESVGLNTLLSADQSAVLGIIDDLRHISQYEIDLPRIIVCGDQSCGKSSVLEAISRLNFPRDESTCTTFATELTLDHQDVPGVSVNILWDDPKNEAEEFRPTDRAVESLGNTINEAKRLIESRNQGTRGTFFKDVLQIKASDPAWPPLTLVDLPGLISSTLPDRDIQIVREIITTHMSKPNTIILAVVCASNDGENQAILKFAEKHDPEGQRTMGILTKPDRIDGTKTEHTWIRKALQKDVDNKLQLGWHVVRNRGPKDAECSFDERDRMEADYFENSFWTNKVNADQLGIDSLRTKLSTILENHVRSALPSIMRKMHSKQIETDQELKDLGPSRFTNSEQQRFLMEIAMKFYIPTKDAINAQYKGKFFKDRPERNLYAQIKKQNKTFVSWMHTWGHTYEETEQTAVRDCKTLAMANNLQPLQSPQTISRANWITKIQQIQEECGGPEPDGFFNPAHLTDVFKDQSSRWRTIAEAHLQNVWTTTHSFLLDAVRYAAGTANGHTADAIIRHIIAPTMETRRKLLFMKLEEILRPFEEFSAMTYDPEYTHERAALYARLQAKKKDGLFGCFAGEQEVQYVQAKLSNYEMNEPEFPGDSSEILDLMKLYYKNALRTFVNNIVTLAIHSCLIHGLEDIFGPMKVNEIARDNEQLLAALANEPEDIQKRRTSLDQQKQDLEKALNKCKEQFGDINMYIMEDNGLFDSTAMPQPSVTVVPPGLASITPASSRRSSSSASLSAAQDHSRTSSTFSTATASTTATEPVPEASSSGRRRAKQRENLSGGPSSGVGAYVEDVPNESY